MVLFDQFLARRSERKLFEKEPSNTRTFKLRKMYILNFSGDTHWTVFYDLFGENVD